MGDTTKIEWTDHTFNPWIGCQKVSTGCDNCYAEQLVHRYGWTEWGPKGVRKRTSPTNWRKPIGWNRKAADSDQRPRVFCASLADVFDNRAPQGARDDLFGLIRQTPKLDWQLLTKRPENIARFLPSDWDNGYNNVWLGVTAEDQTAYDRRWPILASIPAAIRFISYEPATGPVSFRIDDGTHDMVPDWLIWGGESGRHARTMKWEWARSITKECIEHDVAVFGKQWGTYKSNPIVQTGGSFAEAKRLDPPENGKGGALLMGHLWREFPN